MTNDILDEAVDIVVSTLWELSGLTQVGVQSASQADRVKMVSELRALADVIETSPGRVTGLAVVFGLRSERDGVEGVAATTIASGSAYGVAASHLATQRLADHAMAAIRSCGDNSMAADLINTSSNQVH